MGYFPFIVKWHLLHKLAKLLVFLCVLFSAQSYGSRGPGSDKSALLRFKASLSDPYGVLSSWSLKSPDHCLWAGIFCDSGYRVIALNITGGGNSLPCHRIAQHPLYGFGVRRSRCTGKNGKVLGELSAAVAKLSELRILSLPFNELSGGIPMEIWEMEKLEVLDLEGNLISGSLPTNFGGLRSLKVLNLGFNEIFGGIPDSLSNCTGLLVVNLAGNQFNGSFPGFIGGWKDLNGLYLSFNHLSGSITIGIGDNCGKLEHLELSGNYLTEGIPESLVNCGGLKTLLVHSNMLVNISNNGFSGHKLPDIATLCKSPKLLDASSNRLSFNNLSRMLPVNYYMIKSNSSLGNPHLHCSTFSLSLPSAGTQGRIRDTVASSPSSNPRQRRGNAGFNSIEIACITSAAAILSVLVALLVVLFYTRKWKLRRLVSRTTTKEVIILSDIGVPLILDDLLRATGSFNASNCIGKRGFGATYKAEIAPGVLVAIKRLAVGAVHQFDAEVKILGRLRHPNLVTLIGYHASELEMFLVYNYLPGSLEKFLLERPTWGFDWRILHKISLDVARALAYLHDQCVPRVLHRDVKPSNILLDENYSAYLSGFGLARLLGTSETHATTGVAGTFGYIAPEYALTCHVSDKADVYSYGVVLLELISDKKALDPSFSSYKNGFNIVSWACMLLQENRAKEFFTVGLWDASGHDDLVEVLDLAVGCTNECHSRRPTMKQVVGRLKQLQPPLC